MKIRVRTTFAILASLALSASAFEAIALDDSAKQAPSSEEAPEAPLRFALRVSLVNPINGHNSQCYSHIISVPAPKGFRDKWQTYGEANKVVESYHEQFLQRCESAAKRANNALYNRNVSVLWNDTADNERSMNKQIDRYRQLGFPGVQISQ